MSFSFQTNRIQTFQSVYATGVFADGYIIKSTKTNPVRFAVSRCGGSTGAESDETLHVVFPQQNASCRADARRSQLRGLSEANRAERVQTSFPPSCSHHIVNAHTHIIQLSESDVQSKVARCSYASVKRKVLITPLLERHPSEINVSQDRKAQEPQWSTRI